jgi:hypothetical protein
MRNIHPELLLEETKQVYRETQLKADWKFYLDSYSNWKQAVQAYVEHTFQQAVSTPKVHPGEVVTVLTYPLFNWIMERCMHPFSYHTLIGTEEYKVYSDTMTESLYKIYGSRFASAFNSVVTQNITMFACINWEKCGKKTYTVTSKLTEALRATKLNKYPTDLLKSPHAGIYIEFPPNAFFSVANADDITPSDTGYVTLPIEGVYIIEDNAIELMRLWRVIIISKYTEKTSTSVQVNHFYIPLIDGISVDECLSVAIEMMKGEKELPVLVKGMNKVTSIGGNYKISWDKKIIDCAVEIFKFVMNVVIYVTRSDADATFVHVSPEYANFKERMLKAQGKKREELKQRMRSMNPGVRILLGKDYVIKRWDGESKTAGESTGRHINVRTLVSGHWRNQVCGVGGLERKTIWIEPHWRGPEAAPLTEKRAVVK